MHINHVHEPRVAGGMPVSGRYVSCFVDIRNLVFYLVIFEKPGRLPKFNTVGKSRSVTFSAVGSAEDGIEKARGSTPSISIIP